MAPRKHILLALPALLAAMGGAQSSAYASEGIAVVAGLAAAPERLTLDPDTAAVAAQFPAMEAPAEAAAQPGGDEALRRTIFEILAEARQRIGYLPDPVAAPELLSGDNSAGRPLAGETPRRTIFDILADARGDSRFLTRGAAPADSPASAPPAEPMADVTPPTQIDASKGGVAQSVTVETAPGTAQRLAEARSRLGFRPAADPGGEAGAGPALSTDTPRPTIFDVLAEAQGNPGPPTKEAPLAEANSSPGDGSQSYPAAVESGSAQARTAKPEVAPARVHALAAAATVDLDKLDQLRGGFEGPGGLRVKFGIEQAVVVNGVLQSSTQMQVNGLGRAAGSGPNPANQASAPNLVTVVQNGANNIAPANLPAAAMATIVQNSLDNQKLLAITRINATVNSAELLRGVRMQQSLQDALNRAALAR